MLQHDDAAVTIVVRPRQAVTVVVAAGVAIMTLSLVAVLADELLGMTWLMRLDADTEGSVPAWYQSMLLATAAALWVVFAHGERRAKRPFAAWLVLAVVFAAASIDEVVAAHETMIDPLREALGTSGLLYFAWIVPGIAFAAAVGAIVLRPVLRLPRRTRALVIFAGATYVAGALGIEAIGGSVAADVGETGLLYRMVTQLEEVLESTAAVVLLAALLGLLTPRDARDAEIARPTLRAAVAVSAR